MAAPGPSYRPDKLNDNFCCHHDLLAVARQRRNRLFLRRPIQSNRHIVLERGAGSRWRHHMHLERSDGSYKL